MVSVFDSSISDEDDALVQVFNHGGGVHCAGFVTAEEVYAVSSDEHFTVYCLSRPDEPEDYTPPVTAFGDIRERLGCAYVVDVLSSPKQGTSWVAAGDAR